MNSKRIPSSTLNMKEIYSARRQSVPSVIQDTHLIHQSSPSARDNHKFYDNPENQQKGLYQPYGKLTFGGGTFDIAASNTMKNKEKEDVQALLQAKQDLLRKNGFKPMKKEADPDVPIKSFEVLVGGIKQLPKQEQKLNQQQMLLNQMLPVHKEKTNYSPSIKTNESKGLTLMPTQPMNDNVDGQGDNNINVQDIFQLMEHNQTIAKRMQDLQRIIADQKRNIDELPHIHEKNCAQQNHSHKQNQQSNVALKPRQLPAKKMSANPQKNHQRAKSKMEIYGNSLNMTSRNENIKKRNDQMTQDYSNQMILEQSKEAQLRELVQSKKKKVHRLQNRSESQQQKMNKKPSQKNLNDLFKASPFKNRFQESKLLLKTQNHKNTFDHTKQMFNTVYDSGHQHSSGKKCNSHLNSVGQEKEKTWQEKTYSNLGKMQLGNKQKQNEDVLNSFNFQISDIQLVKLV